VTSDPVFVKPTANFQTGRVYDRRSEIHGPFGGNWQSGIAPSSMADAIFIFTGATGAQFGYTDTETLDENGLTTFFYTGEGQVGDMTFTKGNKAILEHSNSGRALHLFRSRGKSKGQEYIGEFVYADHKIETGPDLKKQMRKVIVFELVSVRVAELLESSDPPIDDIHVPKTLAEARTLAIAASTAIGIPSGQSAVRTLYTRSKAVKDYVLMRADGVCESCRKPAPFFRMNGSPYLEPHHTTRLSDGGPDHPQFVGAICPSCHREIHHGKDGELKNFKLRALILSIESSSNSK
jgi:5-methylcytosine-specific restriction protein A